MRTSFASSAFSPSRLWSAWMSRLYALTSRAFQSEAGEPTSFTCWYAETGKKNGIARSGSSWTIASQSARVRAVNISPSAFGRSFVWGSAPGSPASGTAATLCAGTGADAGADAVGGADDPDDTVGGAGRGDTEGLIPAGEGGSLRPHAVKVSSARKTARMKRTI